LNAKWDPGACDVANPRERNVLHFSGRTGKPWFPPEISTECTNETRTLWREYFENYVWENNMESCQGILDDVQIQQLKQGAHTFERNVNIQRLTSRIRRWKAREGRRRRHPWFYALRDFLREFNQFSDPETVW